MNSIEEILNSQDKKLKVFWALDCAEHVLFCFEEMFPNDNRLREAITVGRSWISDGATISDVRIASVSAHNIAREIVQTDFCCKDLTPLSEGSGPQAAACAAARAVGQAVATAHAEGHAPNAATYALKAAAAVFPDNPDEAVSKERQWQYQRLLELTGSES